MITSDQARILSDSSEIFFEQAVDKISNNVTDKASAGLHSYTTESIPDEMMRDKIIEFLQSAPNNYTVELEKNRPFFTIKW